MKSSKRFRLIFFPLVFLSLTACGGGDDDPATTTKAVDNTAPVVSKVEIIDENGGEPVIGDNLTGGYKFVDADGDSDVSTFRWFTDAGTTLGTAKSYRLQSADIGAVVKFEVTAISNAGVKEGNTASSSAITVVDVAAGSSGSAGTTNTLTVLVVGTGGGTVVSSPTGITACDNDAATTTDVCTFDFNSNTSITLTGSEKTGSSPVVWSGAGCTGGNVTLNANITCTATFDLVTAGNGNTGTTNTPPTVNPVIEVKGVIGIKAVIGDILTVAAGFYTDPDPIDTAATKFVWMVDGVAITTTPPNANSYTVQTGDKSILVTVTAQSLQDATGTVDITPVTGTSKNPVVVGAAQAGNVAPVAVVTATTGATGPINTTLKTETALENDTLKGNYTVTDADTGDTVTGPHIFRWLRSINIGGEQDSITIKGADKDTYVVTAADLGATLIFEITPTTTNGTSPGEPVPADGVLVNSAPTATDVLITPPSAVVVAGTILEGTFTYDDSADTPQDPEGTHTFQWYRDIDITDNIPAVKIDGAAFPTAITKSYEVVADDIGAVMVFEVTPVALDGAKIGTPVKSPGLSLNSTAPEVTLVEIAIDPVSTNATGDTALVDSVLTGTYLINASLPAQGNTHILEWMIPGATAGANPKIVTGNTYTVLAADIGKTITFKVTPVDSLGNSGTPMMKDVVVNSSPEVDQTTATGTPFEFTVTNAGAPVTGTTVTVGDTLNIAYTYADVDGDDEDKAATILEIIKVDKSKTSNVSTVVASFAYDAATPNAPVEASYLLLTGDEAFSFIAQVTPIAMTGRATVDTLTDGVMVETATAVVPVAAAVLPTATIDAITNSNSNAAANTASAGDTLTAAYTDGTTISQGQSDESWVIVTVAAGVIDKSVPVTPIGGAVAVDYTVVLDADVTVGTFIAFQVTPVSADGNTTGNAVLSAPIKIVVVP